MLLSWFMGQKLTSKTLKAMTPFMLRMTMGTLSQPVFTKFVGLVLCDLVSVEKSTVGKVSAFKSFADLS